MLRLEEWLKIVGFYQNPFAFKQAEEEDNILTEYFVEHPAFNQILDQEKPRSSVLFASRGSGKSSALKMFISYWDERPQSRPLFVHLNDWSNLVEEVKSIDQISTRDHLYELFRRVVLALAEQKSVPSQLHSSQPSTKEYLHRLCTTYDHYLTPEQKHNLQEWGYVSQSPADANAIYSDVRLPVIKHLHLLSATVQSLGYTACYVLIDNVDELPQTVADWQAGASMLENLIGSLRLHEVPGLAFKYFIPTEVFNILNEKKKIRTDRIGCFNLTWSQEQVKELLCKRLEAFSRNAINSLAPLAAKDMHDIDERLSLEARGSPRHLLNLGEWLIQACADDANDRDALIRSSHFESAQQRYQQWLHQQHIHDPAPINTSVQSFHTAGHDTETRKSDVSSDDKSADSTIPLLSVRSDGCILRGDCEIEGWNNLPALQRRLLEYLYKNHNRICNKEDILQHVWKDKEEPTSDSSLRKLITRLQHFIERDPQNPVYIQHIIGGNYVLKHAASDKLHDI